MRKNRFSGTKNQRSQINFFRENSIYNICMYKSRFAMIIKTKHFLKSFFNTCVRSCMSGGPEAVSLRCLFCVCFETLMDR